MGEITSCITSNSNLSSLSRSDRQTISQQEVSWSPLVIGRLC